MTILSSIPSHLEGIFVSTFPQPNRLFFSVRHSKLSIRVNEKKCGEDFVGIREHEAFLLHI